MNPAEEILSNLYKTHFNKSIDKVEALAQSGSYRQYYRITSNSESVLGVYNTDLEENKAYLSFTDTFIKKNIAVPEVYKVTPDQKAYLIQDLGRDSLWECVQQDRATDGTLSKKAMSLYEKTLKGLLEIQTKTIQDLDLSYCYPRNSFDKQSILWDLNYFKYFFLRLMRISVDEQKLENDIQKLAKEVDKVDQNFFMYRDFQSRNVMIYSEQPFFIDFQGGRKGAIYYDVASLLYDANVEIIQSDRNTLLSFYYNQIKEKYPVERTVFNDNFNLFSIVRLTQALGAFGLRGVVEKKPHFKECIPFALHALKCIIETSGFQKEYPTLCGAILSAHASEYISNIVKGK